VRLSPAQAWELFATARVARLATLRPDGSPHLVPVVFALDQGEVVSAVDHKPKTRTRLVRLENIERDPRVTLLADHYLEDWSQLWWVRIDGEARVVPDGPQRRKALEALVARYEQYRGHPPQGVVVRITPRVVSGWRGTA
jgi:PPOX class probable F420-dependent enzyme